MKLSEIHDYLLNESFNSDLESIEKILKIRIKNEKFLPVKQELILLLLMCLLKKNTIETNQMKIFYENLLTSLKTVKKKLEEDYKKNNTQANRIMLDVFFKTNIYRLYFLELLYKQINLNSRAQSIRVLRKNLQKDDALFRKKYISYFWFLAEKVFSNYWTSFWYLWIIVWSITFLCACLMFIEDHRLISQWEEPLVWLMAEWCNVKNVFDVKECRQYMWFDHYLYVSIATVSNLWWDIPMAWNSWLRFVLWIEQILWVILFWIFVIIVWKKLD